MPFNMAVAGVGGGRTIILAALVAEDLALAYNVESEISSQFPGLAPSQADDTIQLTISGDDYIAASRTGFAIDADGLHDDAEFRVTLLTGCWISGRGGNGGNGGVVPVGNGTAGVAGTSGGLAMRLGCPTTISGTGEIEQGYGGGGGGGSDNSPTKDGGSGGGGGAPLGTKGTGGAGFDNNGLDGSIATNTAKGAGGASVANGGAGGNGGEGGTSSQAGGAADNAGGAAGGKLGSIDAQGFSHSEGGGITITGAVI